MRCFNCGMENVNKAMFCEQCGTRQVLPPIEIQLRILNVGEEKLLGIVPRVALVPFLGLVIGAFALISYFIGYISLANDVSNTDFASFDSGWASDAGAFFAIAAVLGVIAGVVFWGGILMMVLRSD